MKKELVHIPVLKKEVLQYLRPLPNENLVDCTVGGAGHSLAILEKTAPNGKMLGIDKDPEMIKALEQKVKGTEIGERLTLVCDNFSNLKKVIENKRFKDISGILFDLGMSSWHLEHSGRGFSFLRDEPLDMRYNPRIEEMTAAEIVNQLPEHEIARILKEYGEEQFARSIAKEIVIQRKKKRIISTSELVEVIKRAVPVWYQHKKIHFATRSFQALRIATNSEIENLKEVLPQALDVLKKGGRMVAISFHSLEDRIVKGFFRESAQEALVEQKTKKPIVAGPEELKINPRSRSAKLRAVIKI